jgi:hypothetical protein
MVTRPATGGVQQSGAADQAVGAEVHGVEELVVDAAVDDVDPLLARRGPHPHHAVAADEVAALDELDAHQPGQQRVLEVGAVVDAGGEHDDGRVEHARRRGGLEGAQQGARVVADRADPVGAEQLGEHARHRPAVLDDVADARRRAQVVLEDAELALLVADQVDAADVHPHAVGRHDPVRGRRVRAAADDDPARHDAVGQHGLLPAMSARKASSALTRWVTPRSTTSHSSASMTRGTRSRGKGRSSPRG